MDAKFYVYAYLLLAVLYAAGCIQFLNSLSRTSSLARRLQLPKDDPEPVALESESLQMEAQTALRSILDADAAAFACAALPVAYLALSGLLAELLSRNQSAADTINPLWLLLTLALVVAHMMFLMRIMRMNGKLKAAERVRLTRDFVHRRTRRLSYYGTFVLLVTVMNVVTVLYILVNLSRVVQTPYVM